MEFIAKLGLWIAVVSAFVSLVAANHAHHIPARGHSDIAKRSWGETSLTKRGFNGRATYYAVGLGACGKRNVPSDFIVALNIAQYGGGYPGPHCFQTITITYQGKSAEATIMDECPGCPFGGLDMSEGLFTHFAPTSVGVFYMQWSFNGGSNPTGKGHSNPPPPPPPKKTTTHHTTTHHSTTRVPPTSTTSHSHTTHTSHTHTSTATTPTTTGPPAPTQPVTVTDNVPALEQAVFEFVNLFGAASSANQFGGESP